MIDGVKPAPTGALTFLLTDLEGSTRLWELHPEAMKDALRRHDAILRPIDRGFDEGLGTTDLGEARDLLAGLGVGA